MENFLTRKKTEKYDFNQSNIFKDHSYSKLYADSNTRIHL